MKFPRVLLKTVLLLLAFGGIGTFGFFAWAQPHMMKMSGGHPLPRFACTSCHFRDTSPHDYAKGISYPSPADMALSADGSRLYVACEDTDEIVEIGTERGHLLRRLPVGKGPHGLVIAPDSSRLYVTLRREDRVAAIDVGTGEEVGSIPVGRIPLGLEITRDGQTLVAANSGSDDVSLIDVPSMKEVCRLVAGREPYSIAITDDGKRAYVANRLTGIHAFREVPRSELTTLDLEGRRVERRHPLVSGHLAEGVAVSDEAVLVSLVRVRNLVPIMQVSQGWVMMSGVGLLSPLDGTVRQFPLDDLNSYFADPSGVAIDGRRSRAYVASGGGDCVSVLDLRRMKELAAGMEGEGPGKWADHMGISEEYVVARIPTGPTPRKLLLSPGGERLYVAEHLNDAIAIVDTKSMKVLSRISLEPPSRRGQVRDGEIIFHRASITFQGQFSCRSCHPDGHVDGLTYDFAINGLGKNILDNRSLLGIAKTAPFKWNGKNKNLHEQCGPRFAMVLTMADPFAPDDLDDLVAYLESLPPPIPAGGLDRKLTESEMRGKTIFGRSLQNNGEEIPPERRCSTCHRPPLFTNRLTTAVLTQSATDASDNFDTPHLIGIGTSAPYLHDGRAKTLEEIWTVHSPGDTHGQVNDLSKSELNDLVEYLKSL